MKPKERSVPNRRRKRARYPTTLLLGFMALLILGCMPSGSRQIEITSSPVSSKLFQQSNQIKSLSQKALIATDHPGELVWLTEVEMRPLDAQGEVTESGVLQGADLSWLLPQRHHHLSQFSDRTASPLFHVVGERARISLPQGFAIPAMSNEALRFSPVLSNRETPSDFPEFRCSLTLGYSYHRGLETPPIPLFPKRFFAPNPEQAFNLSAVLEKRKVLHFVVGHLPAGCRSLSLLDTTLNKTIFRLESQSVSSAHQVEISIPEGQELDEQHDYLLVSESSAASDQGSPPNVTLYFRDFRFESRRR